MSIDSKELRLDVLPEEGKKELLDFYEFLLQKYGISVRRESKKNIKEFIGIIKLSKEPLRYQEEMRKEWE
ncbi:conserved hypothetical protein [Sulfurihydrogenibium azorense Az-Fu1]|jgi:hypothetical protein|uniref:DUF2281 domain-containing protein n=1 Tax=Sulfurihydrogenibium azorense (strain DSM 15241 / OCM 825 / Az-Fu1) TaxID=204536 RepID=C1DT97_SULAA|nr:DUF2281 domain-containing protein [Sulfurihydrogenibium azorense]ACN99303.1 conserved hypothetical protein [Sulfurihydrogenibium azorense Az-Fu1]